MTLYEIYCIIFIECIGGNMKKLKEIILKPFTVLEEKADLKKIGILLGFIVGTLFLCNFVAYLYTTLQATKIFTDKIDFNVLKEINYFKYILTFVLKQIAFFGSFLVGTYVLCSMQKKDFKFDRVCQVIVVAFVANYLLQAAASLLFMFNFMDIEFLLAIKSAILSAADCFSILILVFVFAKEYNMKQDEKSLFSFTIVFFITYLVRYLLYLVF